MDVLAAFIDACCMEGGETERENCFGRISTGRKKENEYEMSSTKFGREMGKKYEKRRSGKCLHLRRCKTGRGPQPSKGFKG